jgi:putative hydroxymethylpyrimidine transport system ATP-binding protein
MNQLASVMLEQVGLGEHQHKYPEHLSGEQKQRVAIAIASENILLMRSPKNHDSQ